MFYRKTIEDKLQYIVDNYKKIPKELFKPSIHSWDGEKGERYVWLYDRYNNEGYEGSGERIGIRESDGRLTYGYTSHCSCNGPWESSDEYEAFIGGVYSHKGVALEHTLPTDKEMEIEVKIVTEHFGSDAPEILKNIEKLYDIVRIGVNPHNYNPKFGDAKDLD